MDSFSCSRPAVRAIDLFCGAAGLSLGLQRSGIEIVAGVDVDPACRFPFETNIGARFFEEDVADLDGEKIASMFGDGSVRLLAGCAPCQPFSGYTTKRRDIDGRWQLLLEFARLVEESRPELVTLENVPRLAQLPLWHDFVGRLRNLGYSVSWDVLDASRYGVPQARRRLVLLGSRLGEIALPKPLERTINVREAIGKLPDVDAGASHERDPLHSSRALTPANLARIRASKPSGTWRDWPDEMRVKCHTTSRGRTYPSVYGRMAWEKPSPTITTQFYGFGNGRFGHPEQDRAITLREGAILQSFPEGFEFAPQNRKLNFREIGRLIGNAVPPALAQAIGQAILSHVEETRGAL
ncbi:DNA cytosine methyltransferase [Bosea sp. NPDC003192]|uniref:DNA cytosine methyltransferase n=1 Tax=Bosea sp. NPDC003192 TaxID=3390551 RepID=UPI003D0479FB